MYNHTFHDDFFSGSGDDFFNISTTMEPTNYIMSDNDKITLGVGIGCTMLMCLFMLPLYCEMYSDCKKNGDFEECNNCHCTCKCCATGITNCFINLFCLDWCYNYLTPCRKKKNLNDVSNLHSVEW